MKIETNLYEIIYQSILTQLYSGVLRCGQQLPSQKELCAQYHVGITTVRRVIRMLENDGFISSSSGRRAVVCYQESDTSYISSLLQRKESILDMYGGLELLMTALYIQAVKQCTDFSPLYRMLPETDSKMKAADIYNHVCSFFTQLLTPYQNSIILDLHTDMVHFCRIPSLPESIPGNLSGNPFGAGLYTGKPGLHSALSLMEQGKTAELRSWLEQTYRDARQKTENYLNNLETLYPEHNTTSYQWYAWKERMNLYTIVARDLYQRISAGEFQNRPYLPSVPELMRTYGISKSTASSAAALLSDTGLVTALDKKGMILRKNAEWPAVRLDPEVISDHLFLFLCVLQILAVCAEPLFLASVSGPNGSEANLTIKKWRLHPDMQPAYHIVHRLLDFLKLHAPYNCLQSILSQFDNILIWGHYLARPEFDKPRALEFEQVIPCRFAAFLASWENGCPAEAAQRFGDIFKAAYCLCRAQILPSVRSAGRLPSAVI